MTKIYSLEDVKNRIFQRRGDLIVLVEYGGSVAHSKSKFLCNVCGNIWTTTVHAITKPNPTSCPSCANERKGASLRLDFLDVKKYIEESGCFLLSEKYINVDEKLDVTFECGHRGRISFDCFKRGQRCSKCGKGKMARSQRIKKEDFDKILNEKGLEFIEFPDGYENRSSLVTCSCVKCGYLQTKTIAAALASDGCVMCRKQETLLLTSGSMGNNWQGGKSSLTSYLKKSIVPWKKESMLNSGYKCVICGKKFEDVHHTYNFHNIMMETLDELGLKLENSIRKYTQKQLEQIETVVLLKHEIYPGVCLCRFHHALYHKEFGLLNNTPSQFEEFLSRIKSSEIIISN